MGKDVGELTRMPYDPRGKAVVISVTKDWGSITRFSITISDNVILWKVNVGEFKLTAISSRASVTEKECLNGAVPSSTRVLVQPWQGSGTPSGTSDRTRLETVPALEYSSTGRSSRVVSGCSYPCSSFFSLRPHPLFFPACRNGKF